MNIKNRSFEIFVIIALVVISLILFGVYLVVDLYNKSKSYVVFTNPYSIISCEKWECKNISDKLNEYNNKEYNTFINGISVGLNDVYYNNVDYKYYVFNKNDDNILKEEDSLFAYSGKASISGKSFLEKTPNLSQIEAILKSSKVNVKSSDIGYKTLIELDFDGDSENESLVILHDLGIPDEGIKYFSILAYIDNGKVSIINEEQSDDMYSISNDFVFNVIDIFNDGKLEFIDSRIFAEEKGICNIIYRLKGKKFVTVNECVITK